MGYVYGSGPGTGEFTKYFIFPLSAIALIAIAVAHAIGLTSENKSVCKPPANSSLEARDDYRMCLEKQRIPSQGPSGPIIISPKGPGRLR